MVRSYLVVALRNLTRHRVYSLVNIAGLAFGMACAILILLWVQDELRYDLFHEHAHSIYRVEEDQHSSAGAYHVNVTPYPAAPAFIEQIPEVVDAARYSWAGSLLFRYGDNAFYEGCRAADPSFFRMFTFNFLSGDPGTALEAPRSVVIDVSVARKYFGDESPLGKVISVNNAHEMTVTGVIERVPRNSHLQYRAVVSFEFLKELGRWSDHWGNNSITTFVRLGEGASIPEVNGKMTALLRKNNEGSTTDFVLAPLTGIHLHSYFGWGRSPGNIQYVYVFTGIALFVLFIACINFMNLSTARSEKRAKEIGLRKVVGATRTSLVRQFLGESMLLSVLALLIALPLVEALLGPFNVLSGKSIELDLAQNWSSVVGLLGITLATGLVAGSYPAVFLSRFQPAGTLKSRPHDAGKGAAFREVLIVVQFSVSIVLIVATGVVYSQLGYLQGKKLGYNKDQVLYIRMRGDVRDSYKTLKDRLSAYPEVLAVTGARHLPLSIGSNSWGASWEGKDPGQEVLISSSTVDFGYVETLGIEMAEGRSFSEAFASDRTSAFLVNEEVVKLLGCESAVGHDFSFMGRDGKIVGVMKDFHFKSARTAIEPLAVAIGDGNYILIRLRSGAVPEGLDAIREVWSEVVPSYPLQHRFLDREFGRMYRREARVGEILKYFSLASIVIACLGLFGMVHFVASLIVLLTGGLVKWVVVANVVALPVAYYLMHAWLQGFAYRIDLSPGMFLLAGASAVVVALATVSYQAARAAVSDPVAALRYE